MKSMLDSTVMKHAQNAINIKDLMAKFIKTGRQITPQELDVEVLQLGRSGTLPIAKELVEYFINGTVKLLYSEDNILPQTVLFIPIIDNKKMTIIINGSSFIKYSAKTEKFSLNVNLLHSLLLGAIVFGSTIAAENVMKKDYNIKLRTAQCLSSMFSNTISRISSLAAGGEMDKMMFMFNKYLFCTLFEGEYKDSNMFASKVSGFDDVDVIRHIDSSYGSSSFESLDKFVECISVEFKSLNAFTLDDLLRGFTYYGQPAKLALDYLPAALAMVVNSVNGFTLYNSKMMKNTLPKDVTRHAKGIIDKVSNLRLTTQ